MVTTAAACAGACGVSAHERLAGVAQREAEDAPGHGGDPTARTGDTSVFFDEDGVTRSTQGLAVIVNPGHLGHDTAPGAGPPVTIGVTRRAQRLAVDLAHGLRCRTAAVTQRQCDGVGAVVVQRPQEPEKPRRPMHSPFALVLSELLEKTGQATARPGDRVDAVGDASDGEHRMDCADPFDKLFVESLCLTGTTRSPRHGDPVKAGRAERPRRCGHGRSVQLGCRRRRLDGSGHLGGVVAVDHQIRDVVGDEAEIGQCQQVALADQAQSG